MVQRGSGTASCFGLVCVVLQCVRRADVFLRLRAMVRFTGGILLFTALTAARPSSPSGQHVLDVSASTKADNSRQLQGKFLHITDVHPDPYYRAGSDPSGEHPCHHAGDGDRIAGYFGAEKTECDSPFSLVNATFDWIKHNIKDEVDFVVWTGDSARHDNDELYPRTIKQVEQLNNFVVDKFTEVWGKKDKKDSDEFEIPIIPTFGNNDILPHNIFEPGPNKWTRKYLTIWDKFVPQEQRHSFARGGWFYAEVIPNRLAVFSLHTLYFFDSNGAVDGCDNRHEPGYEHFNWLRIQLQFLRERKMKAILTGHVPPARTQSKQNWDETCYQKYTLWLRQYRDVIVGNLFGHMNIDHFTLQDVKQLNYRFKIEGTDDDELDGPSISDELSISTKTDYLADLRDLWGNLPTPPKALLAESSSRKEDERRKRMRKYLKEIGGPFGERFSVSMISPSIVPNFYPTLRIVEYNISGLNHEHAALSPISPGYREEEFVAENELEQNTTSSSKDTEAFENDLSHNQDYQTEKKKKRRKKHRRPKPNFHVPKPPSKTAGPGPAYSPQTLSLLSWRQLFANLTEINAAVAKELDEVTTSDDEAYEAITKKHFGFKLEYDTRDDKVYKMKDLTMRSWLDMAEKIGRTKYDLSDDEENAHEIEQDKETRDDDIEEEETQEDMHTNNKNKKKGKKRKGQMFKKNKLWHTFVKRAFVGSIGDEELEDAFG